MRLPAGVEDNFAQFGRSSARDRVSYLLEVCDPCEATSYSVGGQTLSDFLLPAWYRTTPSPALAYSQVGGCVKRPRMSSTDARLSNSNKTFMISRSRRDSCSVCGARIDMCYERSIVVLRTQHVKSHPIQEKIPR